MSITLDLSGTGKWQRLYYRQFQGNPDNWKRYRLPTISPFELPFLFESLVLAVSTTYGDARPTWKCAGYLNQVYSGLNLMEADVAPVASSPTVAVDAERRRIALNTTQLVIWTRHNPSYYLWFDPMPWIPRLALGVWEYTGEIHDSTEELIETVKVDVTRVEHKIDSLNY